MCKEKVHSLVSGCFTQSMGQQICGSYNAFHKPVRQETSIISLNFTSRHCLSSYDTYTYQDKHITSGSRNSYISKHRDPENLLNEDRKIYQSINQSINQQKSTLHISLIRNWSYTFQGGNSVPVFAALTPGQFSFRHNLQSQCCSLILILSQTCTYQQSKRPIQQSQHLLQKPR